MAVDCSERLLHEVVLFSLRALALGDDDKLGSLRVDAQRIEDIQTHHLSTDQVIAVITDTSYSQGERELCWGLKLNPHAARLGQSLGRNFYRVGVHCFGQSRPGTDIEFLWARGTCNSRSLKSRGRYCLAQS